MIVGERVYSIYGQISRKPCKTWETSKPLETTRRWGWVIINCGWVVVEGRRFVPLLIYYLSYMEGIISLESWNSILIGLDLYIYIYMMAASGLPVPPPPRMGWVQNLRFSYIFMEPAKTHGIYTVLTSSASETVVFAAFCNTTLYTTTLIVLLLQKQQQLLLLLPLLRTTTYYYVLLRTSYTYYYVLRIRTTYYYVLLRTTTYFVYVLLRTTYTYYVLLCTTTYYYVRLRTTTYYYVLLRICTTYTYTHRGGAGTLCVHVVSLCADTKTMTCRPCLDTYIHTYKQTINQYKQNTYTWLQMVRPPPTHPQGGGPEHYVYM